ncbi:hypothetical protein J41TS12_11030 [Paenibacillus antibioticophila]|uniref:Uncharacterized protein n=1 Tax=Paenibacillus antibioticophila TaxID=1274374 RepID=A0A919XNF2_9BACL|nr:hypothetical protein [Paenibacillus antibioticophila]GIO36242.1 hypothetical protein J41TS12_11030 [Paenibacillus antibioticophila]
MEIREINVSMTYTKNLGNYESLKLDAGVTVAITPDENVDQAYAKAWEVARKQIRAQLPARGGVPV